jgi:hypothetical protein
MNTSEMSSAPFAFDLGPYLSGVHPVVPAAIVALGGSLIYLSWKPKKGSAPAAAPLDGALDEKSAVEEVLQTTSFSIFFARLLELTLIPPDPVVAASRPLPRHRTLNHFQLRLYSSS